MSKEYIEREAAIEELKRRDFLPVIVKHAIEAVSAADVAPVVHGRWVFNGICTSCSECGSNNPTKAHDQKLAKDDIRFCYFCGARMDSDVDVGWIWR